MKPGIEAQLALEDNMLSIGAQRYVARQKKAEQNDRGAETDYARRLIKEYVLHIASGIRAFLDDPAPKRRGKVRGLLAGLDVSVSAYLALRGVFNAFPTRKMNVQTVSINIGRTVEDEIRFTKFQDKYKQYYDQVIRDFKRKNTKSYRHKHRVLTFKANEMEDGWTPWSDEERLVVGAFLIDMVKDHTELCAIRPLPRSMRSGKRRSSMFAVVPTERAEHWILRYMEHAAFLDPARAPCIIEPAPWSEIDVGGYYSPKLRAVTPFVINASKAHMALLHKADLSEVFSAVNAMQSTPWQINKEVLEVMQAAWQRNLRIGMPSSEPVDIPACPLRDDQDSKNLSEADAERFLDWKREAALLHTEERERVSKSFQTAQALRTAQEYSKYDRIWFVYQCDFRSRTYAASAGLSPQGTDPSKALLQFAEARPLGVRGMFWLAVHGANVYGFDKASYNERAHFINSRAEAIHQVADDPLSHREFWANADKPWQFLAFCFEYSRALRSGPKYASRLRVALDGSCNGLQHFSAMLKDAVGGAATNLCRGDVQADIYGEVARVCYTRLAKHTDPVARQWMAFCARHGNGSVPRAIAKRPVMTLPYGSTLNSCIDHVFQCIRETEKGFFPDGDFKAAVFLAEVLWDSIGEVVVSAREAMDFLRNCADVMTSEDRPLVWTTPTGFPVHQAVMHADSKKIDTLLCGRMQVRLNIRTSELSKLKQKQGVSPNYVHSRDAAHMHKTILSSMRHGITDFGMVHDDFGTHACNIDILHRVLREEFVALYGEGNCLDDLRTELKVRSLPKAPARGTLNINEVLEADFFFG